MRLADGDLDALLEEARAGYAASHSNSADWVRRADSVLPGGETRSVLSFDPFPFRVERAKGQYLFDVDGHRYVDFLGNYTAGLLGHSPGPVQEAVRRALEAGWAMGAVGQAEVQLAELVTSRFRSIEQVRFTNSGTEANLMALALALHHTKRRKVLVFEGGYHGGVLTYGQKGREVNVPHETVLVDFNDIASIDRVFAELGPEIGAVLVEPMQGSGGCLPADPEFLQALRAHASTHGCVLVFDEVMTSRLSVGGAQQVYGIYPDLTTLGKYVGGGFSFGAFGGSAEMMSAFDRRRGGALGHAGTFNNNVVSMTAGVATLAEVLTPEVLDRTNRLGDMLRSTLNEIFELANVPMCVTGMGSLMNVHGLAGPVGSPRQLADADTRLTELFFFHALACGFYVANRGFIALSIEITADDINEFIGVVEGFVAT